MSDADDKEAVDRAFAELVAGYHLTAERSEPPTWEPPPTSRPPEAGSVFEPPRPMPELELPLPDPIHEPTAHPVAHPAADPATDPATDAATDPQPVPEERFDPGPPAPLPPPAWPVLVGWIGLGYAMLTVLALAVGVDLPRWAAWAGVLGFLGGFGLLVSRLPRQRPPDAGDGAVL